MANTFTVETHVKPSTVVGNMRTVIGTLNSADGGAASSVASGLDFIYGGTATKTSATTAGNLIINSNVNGDFKITSAATGDAYLVMLNGK